jgi:hypothetical protein
MIKKFLKQKISVSSRRKLRNLIGDTIGVFFSSNLNILGRLYGTDKIGGHSYTPHYMTHLKYLRDKKINLLEIGVGGYEDPNSGGNSLKMWKKYFPYGQIFGLDIYDKSSLQENRITIFKGSQVDKEFLYKITSEIGKINIIIDDGSHLNNHVVETFTLLFPKLINGGIYVIEDTQTSYMDYCGGDSKDLNNPQTTMNFFKSLTDTINSKEYDIQNNKTDSLNYNINSMHFYHNLIFIYKGENSHKS